MPRLTHLLQKNHHPHYQRQQQSVSIRVNFFQCNLQAVSVCVKLAGGEDHTLSQLWHVISVVVLFFSVCEASLTLAKSFPNAKLFRRHMICCSSIIVKSCQSYALKQGNWDIFADEKTACLLPIVVGSCQYFTSRFSKSLSTFTTLSVCSDSVVLTKTWTSGHGNLNRWTW